MSEEILLEEVITKSETWYQMFDMMRIIEPGGTHRVLISKGREDFDLQKPCYSLWNREEHCANCVSKRACMKREAVMKIEYRDSQYFLVLAKPILIEEKEVILELVMNISKQLNSDEEDMELRGFVLDIVNRLEAASEKETFTNLYNKNHMIKVYEQKKAEQCNKLYMALMDVDNFKIINDTYGHDIGDQAILTIAETLKGNVAEEDGITARFGGDEFGIIFTGEDEASYREKLADIKSRIDKITYQSEGVMFNITISCGMADVSGTETFSDAIHKVDKELYEAKKRGMLNKYIVNNK